MSDDATPAWVDDPMFARGALGDTLSPAFRVSAYLPHHAAHPFVLTDAWEALFACFKPIVEDRCDRVRMWEKAGAKARRSKSIQTADWHPFKHLKAVDGDPEGAIFLGFSFADKSDDADLSGRGPCAVRFFVGKAIRFDATIAVDDWIAGRLDIDAVVAALQALPYVSFTAGYGLCLGERYAQGDGGDFLGRLIRVGQRFPAFDLLHAERRAYFPGSENDFEQLGLAGINWITGVGEPFFTRGGKARLGEGLPTEIGVQTGPQGIVFKLGDGPITGEAGVDDATLPLYATLGARLKALSYPQPRPSPVFGDAYPTDSLAWERRFFDGRTG